MVRIDISVFLLLSISILAGCDSPPANSAAEKAAIEARKAPVETANVPMSASRVLDAGIAVSGGASRSQQWCVAGRFARSKLGLPADTTLRYAGAIGRGGLNIGRGPSATHVPGPGVVFTYGKRSVLDFIGSGRGSESRTIGQSLSACGGGA